VDYLIFQEEIKRIAREMLAVTRTFAGKDLASAFANLFQVVSPDQVVAVTARERCAPEETVGIGDSRSCDGRRKIEGSRGSEYYIDHISPGCKKSARSVLQSIGGISGHSPGSSLNVASGLLCFRSLGQEAESF
jgi:hypothetical protein